MATLTAADKKRYTKLIMVTAENNNKYYEMTERGDGMIDILYGRVDSTKIVHEAPMSKWDKIVKSKTDKGYVDVTDLVSEQITVTTGGKNDGDLVFDTKTDARVKQFITLMKSYTDKLVSTTYSVKSDNVSQKQIDRAQEILNDLQKIDTKDTGAINTKLLELYGIIPRFMKNVKQNILPEIKVEDILQQEQDNLDAIASQVKLQQPATAEEKKELMSILDNLGITMQETSGKHTEIDYLLKQIDGGKLGKRVETIFEVNKPAEETRFKKYVDQAKNKETRYLIHGTRCTSVIPILKEGLKIHPSGNYQFSGKIYGDGNYFSEVCVKSLGYTGYDNDKILLVYEVHTGNPYVYHGRYNGSRGVSLNYKSLTAAGYDSTHVEAGNGLLNSEIIAYHEHQNTLRYIIWLKNLR